MIKEMLLVLRIFFVASLKLIQRLNGVFPAGVEVLVNIPLITFMLFRWQKKNILTRGQNLWKFWI